MTHSNDAAYNVPQQYIDGIWREGTATTATRIVNPATEAVLGELSHASSSDLDEAILAAKAGFALWRKVTPYERGRLIERAVALMLERREHIARLITLEQGKPLVQARAEVTVAADMIKWYGEQARRIYGRIVPSQFAGAQIFVQKEPVGPCALFSPWNMPVLLAGRKLGGALAAGCSCVIKPAEETPAGVAAMVACFVEAGVPAGVINLVFGQPADVSSRLLASPVIRKVSFTGSVAVGKLLARQGADNLKQVTLELGGHAPVIVMGDADIDSAVAQTAAAKFRNAGQVCLSPTRFFVQSSVYERFVDAFGKYASQLRVGNGLDPETQMGPLASDRRLLGVQSLVDDAVQQGSTIVSGGTRIGDRGFFYAPTVLCDVPASARATCEEAFGPIALITPVADVDEAISAANASELGLASYAFTDSAAAQARLASEIEAGVLAINNIAVSVAEAPFGGVKDSGYGYESGEEGLEGYLHTKTIHRQA
ncbi:NAD-dependent succinate-semialdehyde dehydrogenase [Cupriavidus pauculus]|uniref:NAD-dependent succinate-semialdehyde dehydrogenase n=1 Tax=Cupriavidus pauculus TaxID=82633 RepID=A0A5P2H146_9BURK|nr:NAD-dependent succinate-semialdehyde dehydrogenase [Cupriavidus pauculus]QET01677.1 NAD-dependent succinate-semialdehyde dehydrogenase [Cupriavidus pauculus]